MILNGKCADRFKEWIIERYNGSWFASFESLQPVVQYALIIDFMDSEGILIEISLGYDLMAGYNRGFDWYVRVDKSKTYFTNEQDVLPSRTEALKAAIEKGNLIFNER